MKTFRTERVSELIKQEVSDLLLRGIKDVRVGAGMVSITRVDVPGDTGSGYGWFKLRERLCPF
jgi:ribosome-binding factor A